MDIENDKFKDMAKDTVKDEAKSAAEDKAFDKKAAVDSGVNKALGEDAGGIVNNATDTALSGGLDGKSADEIKKQVTEQAKAEAKDKAQTAATDEAARASAKLEEKYGKAGGVAGQGIEAVAEGDFSGDSDQIKDSIKSNVEDKAGDAVESEVDSAVSGQSDKVAAQADEKVSGAGDLVDEGADSVSENVSDSIKQSVSSDEAKESVEHPKVETPKAKDVVTQKETAEAKPEAPSETGEACEDPQSFNGPLKWAPPPKSLQFAPNVNNTWVIDYDVQPWQSVAVVPQMYKWKHEFPAPKAQGPFDPNYTPKPFDPNSDPKPDWGKSNAIDFFNETFLKERLAELEKNELTEVTLGAGFLYVYCNGYLCMEYEVRPNEDPTKLPALHAIDLTSLAGCDKRLAGDDSVSALELPFGGCEDQKYELAYSQYQWPWILVNFYGGVSEDLDFGDDFTKAYVHDPAALPDVIKAEEDERILKRSPADAEARRAERFTVVDLAEGTDFIAFKEAIEKPDLFISKLMPDSLADLYPQLRDEPDFEYPCNWAIHYTIEDANALALQIVESFHRAHAGLMTLIKCMGDTKHEEFFPYVRYFEAAMLTAQLYYATPNTKNQAQATTKWARDHNYAQFTDKLAHEDILSVLMTKERAVYRNILLVHTHLLGTIMAPGHSQSLEWKTTKGKTLKHERLHTQLMAFLDGLRCSPLLKDENPVHDPCRADSPVRSHAGDRWGHINDLKYPFTIDPVELGLLFAGEPSYHDNYIKSLSSFRDIGAYIQRSIIEGEGPGKRIAQITLPNSFEALFNFETIYAELFALDDQAPASGPETPNDNPLPDKNAPLIYRLANGGADNDEVSNSEEVEDSDPHAKKRQELKEKLYEKWLEVLTVDQNKKAEQKDEFAFTSKELKDFLAGVTPVFKLASHFALGFPKVISQIVEVPLLAEIHFDNVKKLVSANSSIYMEKTRLEKIFKAGELKFNEDLNKVSLESVTTLDNYNSTNKKPSERLTARENRQQYIYEFLTELDDAADKGRGDAQADATRKEHRDNIDRDNARHNNRSRLYNRVVTTTDQQSYDAAKDLKDKRTIVLSPEDSKVWTAGLETNIYLINTKGAKTYKEAIAKHVDAGSTHLATQGLFAFVDLYNMYTSISALSANGNAEKQAMLIAGVLNSTLGFTGSAADVLGKYSKMGETSKSVGMQVRPVSRFSTAIIGKTHEGWKLSRYTVGTKYIPVVGGLIGLTMSSIDLNKSIKSGDDVIIVHGLSMVAGLSGIVGVFFWSAYLGPIGIGLAILGFLASKFIFKQDDELEEWLDHGPFASRGSSLFMQLKESQVKWSPSTRPSYHFGVENTLTVEKEEFWGDDKYTAPEKVLRIRFSGQYIVFDKNYTLLGIHQDLARIPTHPTSASAPSKYPSYFKVDGNQLLFKDKPIGELGKPFANSALELRRRMQQYYTEATGYSPKINRSDRFDAGWSSLGDTDEKYTIPFQKIPEANIEALLNATYPLSIALEMYSSVYKKGPRERKLRQRGNNIAITLDVPYFIEGQSKLIVELREDAGWFDNRYEKPVVPIHYDKATKESEYRIEIDTVIGLQEFKEENKTLVSDNVEYKAYRSNNNGVTQVIIIANIDPRLIHDFDKRAGSIFSLEAWARLSINGANETDKTVLIDGEELKALWMPYRSPQGWEDYINGYDDEKIKKGVVTNKSKGELDPLFYASDDKDWVSAADRDRVRRLAPKSTI